MQTPRLVRLNQETIPLLEQGRALSACTNDVLVPFVNSTVPDPDFPDNTGTVNQQIQRSFPGLSGESRLSDGGTQYFHAMAVPLGDRVRPGSPTDGGRQPPPRRPDQPCELQELPNLHAPGGPAVSFPVTSGSPTAANQSSFRPRDIDPERTGDLLPEGQAALHRRRSARRKPGSSGGSRQPRGLAVTTAIRKHLGDFLAVLALFVLAIGIGGYILSQERLRFPIVEEEPFRLKVELDDAQAVIPGQGQTVRVAGVQVGDIGSVELEEGIAVVEMQIEPKYEGLLKQDATALLRTKTGLKDMFLEVDPGSGSPWRRATGSSPRTRRPTSTRTRCSRRSTPTRVTTSSCWSPGAGKGLKGRGTDLRETFRRFEPLHRDLARVTTAIARRRENLKRLVHNYSLLTKELADNDQDLTRLVRASNAVLEAFAAEDDNLSAAISKLPGALGETKTALIKADRLGQQLGPTLESLRPAFRKLDEANAQVLPLAREGTPIVRDELRPFARIATPYFKDLGEAGRDLAKGAPDLTTSFEKLNRLFNIGAYNPGGAEGISGGCESTGACTPAERNRNEGYLYWLGWTAQNTVSLFNTGDAHGPLRRIFLGGATCATLQNHGPAGRRHPDRRSSGALHTMIKQTPSIGRIIGMVVFTLSCFGLLLFLWLAFGGSVPLKPEGYRVKVAFPEAATLAVEADVRMAGVNVGKVKTKELQKSAARTLVEIEVKPQYAPIPKDSRAILRQKTLLGETYVEISTGDRRTGDLDDGSTLPNPQVEDTVQLDEIFNAFDQETRDAFQEWVAELSKAIKNQRGEDLNSAFGNLEGFAVDGAKLLETLDEQEIALRRLVKNTGVVFGALNERDGQLRELIVNSNNTFEATASRDAALAETFAIFPTFLDESKATLARLEVFARETHPLVNDLKGPADDLGPTLRDLGDLAPDLEALFRDLDPLISASEDGSAGARADRGGARAVLRERPPLLPRAQPGPLVPQLPPGHGGGIPLQWRVRHLAEDRRPSRPDADRHDRAAVLPEVRGAPAVGARQRLHRPQRADSRPVARRLRELRLRPRRQPAPRAGRARDALSDPNRPPCFEAPGSLYDGKVYPHTDKGKAPNVNAPGPTDGTHVGGSQPAPLTQFSICRSRLPGFTGG